MEPTIKCPKCGSEKIKQNDCLLPDFSMRQFDNEHYAHFLCDCGNTFDVTLNISYVPKGFINPILDIETAKLTIQYLRFSDNESGANDVADYLQKLIGDEQPIF